LQHNHPVRIADCVAMLLKIFNNVLEHPEEQKFRQVSFVMLVMMALMLVLVLHVGN